MAEYVKRDDAIRELEKINPVDYGAMWNYDAHHHVGECLRDCKEALCELPAADVAPVVHAWWIEDGSGIIICPKCNRGYNLVTRFTHYCPNCGAKMDGGDDNETDCADAAAAFAKNCGATFVAKD